MKRRYTFTMVMIVAAAMIVVAPSGLFGQVTLQAGGGLTLAMPSGDYSGTQAEYYAGSKYGLSTGYGVHAKLRAGLFGFILKGGLAYTSLSNSGDAPGGGSVELSHSIITLAVGPEFHIGLPALPVTPYLGADLQLNMFSGETVFKGISAVPSSTLELEAATRIGLGVNAGVILSVGAMKLDVGISYNMLNMAGKAWSDPQPTRDVREDSYGGLNDEKDPLIAAGGGTHFIGAARSIDAINVTATLMFGI